MNKEPSPSHPLSLLTTSGHPQTVAVFHKLAEGFDVAVQPVHLNYWQSMLTVGRALDSYVDSQQPASIQKESAQLIKGIPIEGVTDDEASEFSHIFHTVSVERRAAIMQGFTINDYSIAMRQADTYEDFLRLRVLEAEVFGQVMQLDNPSQERTVGRFNTWLPRFARAGYLLDSFGDLSADYRDGIIGMQPTLRHRLRLGRQALHESRDAISELPPRTIAFLAAASLSKIVRNGLKKK